AVCARCSLLMGSYTCYRRRKMDLCVPTSLHLPAFIATLLNWQDTCLVRHVNDDCYRISCSIILRLVVSLPYDHSLHSEPTVCQSTFPGDAGKHSCRPRSRSPSQRVRIICDKI